MRLVSEYGNRPTAVSPLATRYQALHEMYDGLIGHCGEQLQATIQLGHLSIRDAYDQFSPRINPGRQSGKTLYAALRATEDDLYIGLNSAVCKHFRATCEKIQAGYAPLIITGHEVCRDRGRTAVLNWIDSNMRNNSTTRSKIFVDDASYYQPEQIATFIELAATLSHRQQIPPQLIFLG